MLSKTLFGVWNIQELSVQIETGPGTCVCTWGALPCGTSPPLGSGTELVTKTNKNPGLCWKFRGVPVYHRPEIKSIQAKRDSVWDEEQRAAFPFHPLS